MERHTGPSLRIALVGWKRLRRILLDTSFYDEQAMPTQLASKAKLPGWPDSPEFKKLQKNEILISI